MNRNERITDFFIGKLLDDAGISYIPNGSNIKEIQTALKTASKKGTNKVGFPEFTSKVENFILVIENKADEDRQVLYDDDIRTCLSTSIKAISNYAENGALHYAQQIIQKTTFKKVFAFGCSGDEKHHTIRPIFVDENGYQLLPEVENFTNFTSNNIANYYRHQVLGETPFEQMELQVILSKAKELHESLRNYGQLGDSEKPLVVSAILLALSEKTFNIDTLTGDDQKTDGQILFDYISTYMNRAKVTPSTKKEKVLGQFSIIKDRSILNQIDDRLKQEVKKETYLAKTPLRFFTEYVRDNIIKSVNANTAEDVLGRFYGEFISFSGGDGQTLGVVLTPKHITELFCDLVDIQPNDKVFDPCCGTSGFLIASMHKMLDQAKDKPTRDRIKQEQLHGIEIREDMFSIATTNMILRGDGKSNLENKDFLKIPATELRKNKFTVGFINPPYSQAKNKETIHLSEINFIKHLLDSLDEGAKCVAIIPQSTMVGKRSEDKKLKRQILEMHTLEGVLTLNKNTFYGVGTNVCIAVFKAHIPHNKDKRTKFINFEDDGYIVSKHVGLTPTERALEKKQALLDWWFDRKDAESKYMVKTTVEADDEWLHSFYYFNDDLPKEHEFEKIIGEYLTFEFNMILQGKEYLFKSDIIVNENNAKTKKPGDLNERKWNEFFIEDLFFVKSGKRLTKAEMHIGNIPFIGASDSNNGITQFISNRNSSLDKNILGVNYNGSVVENFYHPYEAVFSDDVKRLKLKNTDGNKYLYLFIKNMILKQKSKYEYGYKFNGERMKRQKIMLPIKSDGKPDYEFMQDYMKFIETEKMKKFLSFKNVI